MKVLRRLEDALIRRVAGEPLAYIVGEKGFYGRKFYVDGRVLIPRPETEALVDLIKTIAEGKKLRILEVGTGSGCLAVTLAREMPMAEILATDISAEALAVARENVLRLGVKVRLQQADLLEGVNGKFDIVVANLPYVDMNWDWLERGSLDYEPAGALYSKRGGLAHYEQLLRQLNKRSSEMQVKYLVVEADPCQQDALAEMAVRQGFTLVKRQGFGMLFSR